MLKKGELMHQVEVVMIYKKINWLVVLYKYKWHFNRLLFIKNTAPNCVEPCDKLWYKLWKEKNEQNEKEELLSGWTNRGNECKLNVDKNNNVNQWLCWP